MAERNAYLDLLALLRSRSDIAGMWSSMLHGEGGDLSDIRPYMPGDKLQRIHRPSFARGELLVKEFSGDRHATIDFVFDISLSLTRARGLESVSAKAARDSVSLILGLLCGAADFWGVPISVLCIVGEKAERIEAQEGSACLRRALDALDHARLDNLLSPDFALALVKRGIQQTKGSLVFFASDFLLDAERYKNFFEECAHARKLDLIPVFINTAWIWDGLVPGNVEFQIAGSGRDASKIILMDKKTMREIQADFEEQEKKLRALFTKLDMPWINLKQPVFFDYVREITRCFAEKHRFSI